MRFERLLPLAAGLVLSVAGCEQSTGPSEDPPPPLGPPVIRSFGALKSTLDHGEATNLVWRVDGANVASISGIGVVTPTSEGAFNIRPYETVSYTLLVSNDQGTVEATTTVEVRYPAGIFVSSVNGDDDATGDSPATALETLDAALGRAQGGGFIFLSAGFYQNEVVIDGVDVDIYGGLDPVTFFEDPASDLLRTTIQPVAGVPLTVRGGSGIVEMTNVTFDTRGSGAGRLAAVVDGAQVWFRNCTLDGKTSTEATGIRILGSSDVQLVSCKIYGANPLTGPVPFESRGVDIRDASSVLISHCFVDGGRAQSVCSGVEVATTGVVRIGLSSIAAEITAGGGTNSSAAVRIHQGHPKIGGNILLTRGTGRRFGVSEEAPNTDPSGLQYNLFISVSSPPYNNSGTNDPRTAEDLNGKGDGKRNPLESNPLEAYGNLLETGISASSLFPIGAIEQGDFHLVSPVLSNDGLEQPNPALNQGTPILATDDYVGNSDGGRFVDIDGDNRPLTASLWDLGADEL